MGCHCLEGLTLAGISVAIDLATGGTTNDNSGAAAVNRPASLFHPPP